MQTRAARFIADCAGLSNHALHYFLGCSLLPDNPDLPHRLLRLYKRWLSPLMGKRCRFFPSCSVYCAQCVSQHGWLAGGWMGVNRLLRCQPLCESGFDPVPERFLWRGSRVQATQLLEPDATASENDPSRRQH